MVQVRRSAVEMHGGTFVVTGHDVQYRFLRAIGFGLTSNYDPHSRKNRDAQQTSDDLDQLSDNVLLVDGEIHSTTDDPLRLPYRFAGAGAVISADYRGTVDQVPRRLPVSEKHAAGARRQADALADKLFADSTAGLSGLVARIRENVIQPMFAGGQMLRYFHFHDLMMRYMSMTKSMRATMTAESVDEFLDDPVMGDVMESLYYYILCYMGKPRAEAIDRLRVLRIMRTTRKGRDTLLTIATDLRLLGDAGLMSKKTFDTIAKHLVATEMKDNKVKMSSRNVQLQLKAIKANVGRTDPARVISKFFGRTIGVGYQDFRPSYGRHNRTTAARYMANTIKSGNSWKTRLGNAKSSKLQGIRSAVGMGPGGVLRHRSAVNAFVK